MKKALSLLLAILLVTVGEVPAMALETDETHEVYQKTPCENIPINIEDNNSFSDIAMNEVNASSATYAWKVAFKAIRWLLVKGSNALFSRQPLIEEGENWVGSSTGDVSFGNGDDDVRRVKFTNTISIPHNSLIAFARTGVLGWLNTITIFVEDSSGDEVYGGQVTHNQHLTTSYDLPLDTYTTFYVYSGNQKWDCWIHRFDFTDDYSRSATYHYMADSNMVYNPNTQKSYIIPSDTLTLSSRVSKKGYVLTAQDLVNEFHDEKLNCSVNRMKNYDIGDTIYVTDIITGMEYNSDKNVTTIYFGNTADGSFSWPFTGDLRDQFNVNDELTFKFDVVEEYATIEYSFETLDYFLESYDLIVKNTAANIEDYLVR